MEIQNRSKALLRFTETWHEGTFLAVDNPLVPVFAALLLLSLDPLPGPVSKNQTDAAGSIIERRPVLTFGSKA